MTEKNEVTNVETANSTKNVKSARGIKEVLKELNIFACNSAHLCS